MERKDLKMRFTGIATIGRVALIAAVICLTRFDAALNVTAQSATQTPGQSRELHETYDLTSGGVVYVTNTSGYIRVTSWNENRVKVDAVKRSPRGARDEEFSEVDIQITPRPGRIEIRTIYPRSQGSRVSVDYDLKVPRTSEFNAQTANGEITVNDPVARVTANSSNGTINIREVTGDATLLSANGQISTGRIGGSLTITSTNGNMVIGAVESALNARCGNCNISARGIRDDASAHTANGAIDLENVGGRVSAEALNGRIRINEVGGDVTAKNYSSSVTVTNARGHVAAETLSGNVIVRNAGEGARAKSISGQVEISDSKGRIEADATNGSITLNNIDGKDVSARSSNGGVNFAGKFYESGRYVFFSANGNVILTLPAESNFNLSIRSDNGSMKTDFPLKLGPGAQLGRGPIVGVVGNGGADVRAVSSNGSVHIKKAP